MEQSATPILFSVAAAPVSSDGKLLPTIDKAKLGDDANVFTDILQLQTDGTSPVSEIDVALGAGMRSEVPMKLREGGSDSFASSAFRKLSVTGVKFEGNWIESGPKGASVAGEVDLQAIVSKSNIPVSLAKRTAPVLPGGGFFAGPEKGPQLAGMPPVTNSVDGKNLPGQMPQRMRIANEGMPAVQSRPTQTAEEGVSSPKSPSTLGSMPQNVSDASLLNPSVTGAGKLPPTAPESSPIAGSRGPVQLGAPPQLPINSDWLQRSETPVKAPQEAQSQPRQDQLANSARPTSPPHATFPSFVGAAPLAPPVLQRGVQSATSNPPVRSPGWEGRQLPQPVGIKAPAQFIAPPENAPKPAPLTDGNWTATESADRPAPDRPKAQSGQAAEPTVSLSKPLATPTLGTVPTVRSAVPDPSMSQDQLHHLQPHTITAPSNVSPSALVTPSLSHPPQIMRLPFVDAVVAGRDGSLKLQMTPEDLGPVRLTFQPGEAGLQVHIAADRSDTLELIRRHLDAFVADLRREGFGSLMFSFSDQQTPPHKAQATDQPADQTDDSDLTDLTRSTANPSDRTQRPGLNGQLDLRL